MSKLTRATATLLGAAIAGFAIWVASQLDRSQQGDYWATVGLLAGAGLVMALSQLAGGWTKWGRPRISLSVLLIAFVPVAVVSLWIVLVGEPGSEWFHRHVSSWSGDIGVRTFVTDMRTYVPVLAFGTGLVFGFSFETSGPRPVAVEREDEVETGPAPDEEPSPDEEPVVFPPRQRETTHAS